MSCSHLNAFLVVHRTVLHEAGSERLIRGTRAGAAQTS